MKTIIALILNLVLCVSPSGPAVAAEIRINKVTGDKEMLILSILELILSKSAPDTTITQFPEILNEKRQLEEIQAGNIEVMWAGAAPEKEKALRTVRIPVLKGLLGHRIFIIRDGEQGRFDNIETLDQLKRFSAGQGRFWGDTKVLQTAGIPTVTTIKYANLFPMLEGGRFDYFPRAVHEPWSEVTSRPKLNLTVEKHLMLVYPFAMYFYVAKEDTKLHDILYNGFEMAINDGSFNEMFFNHPMIRDVLEKANLRQRMLLRIDNPHMHPDTPTDRAEFWLDISKL